MAETATRSLEPVVAVGIITAGVGQIRRKTAADRWGLEAGSRLAGTGPMTRSVRTLEDLEHEVAALPFETLMRRYGECAKGGHVWRPLVHNLGPSTAEYCGSCLRVRIGRTFEGWTDVTRG